MGGAVADARTAESAYQVGRLIAENGWVLLNGGRNAGVMAASASGAADAGGLVVGVLPGEDRQGVAPGVHIAIPTGVGDARNVINVLASHVVVALRGGAGTISEIALALNAGRTVVALDFELGPPFEPFAERGLLLRAGTPEAAIALVRRALGEDA